MFSFMYCRSVAHRALSHDGFNPGSSFTSDLQTTFASLWAWNPPLCMHGELRQRKEMWLGATHSDTSSWLTSALWAEKSLKQQGFLPWDSGGSTSAAQPLPSPAPGPRHSPAPRIVPVPQQRPGWGTRALLLPGDADAGILSLHAQHPLSGLSQLLSSNS